jgi:hypothetical protein
MSETNKCIAILKSGERANQQCGSKVSDGTTFCKRHSSTSTSPTPTSSTTASDMSTKVKTIKPPKTKKGSEIEENMEVEQKEKVVKAKSEPKKKSTSVYSGNKSEKTIFKLIENRRQTFFIERHESTGLYIHKPTRLIFDQSTQEVVGKLLEDNSRAELTIHDIHLCKENRWKFRAPVKVVSDKKPANKVSVDLSDESDGDDDDEEMDDD